MNVTSQETMTLMLVTVFNGLFLFTRGKDGLGSGNGDMLIDVDLK